jgi:protoporphyrinogen oxidase
VTDHDVAVLGAGPAGLAAAYRLAQRGRSVVVLERSHTVGGLAGSFEVGGMRVDHGSHRLHPSCAPPIMAVLRDLLGADLQRRVRNGRVRLGGRWVAFPPRAGDLVRHLPPRFAAGVARDALTARWRRLPRADTFAEVVRAGLGPTMANGFYGPYVRKIWGVDPGELSGELARRRVGARSPGALWRKLARPNAAKPDARAFYYPRRGYGSIVERLADAAVDAGAKLELGAEVSGIDLATGGDTVVHRSGAAPIVAGQAWSTLPLTLLARLIDPPAPPAARAAAEELSFRALALVYLVLDRPRYTPFDAHYFPDLDVPFSRISEPKNYRDGAGADPSDRTVLCAEVPCARGDAVWKANDDELGARVAAGLAAQGLPDATPTEVVVRRVPAAYPLYDLGYEARFARLDEWARSLPSVLTFGRHGLFTHDNTHHALAMGWAAADAAGPDGEIDGARWDAARRTFASHVVED